MTLPDYETLMLPPLKLASDDKERFIGQAAQHHADLFKLSLVGGERTTNGQSTYIKNRADWARTYLKKVALLSPPKQRYSRMMQNIFWR